MRYLLPLCLIAAALVAAQGLLTVLERTGAPAVAETPVSLTLGAAGHSIKAPAAAPITAPDATPSASPKPVAKPAATKPAAGTPRLAPVPVTTPVAVFNASRVTGLAGRTASFLRDHGVVVASVDNLAKPLAVRTVFYPPGQLEQARTLAALTHTTAVRPTPDWLGASGRLVLVVTDPESTSAPLAVS